MFNIRANAGSIKGYTLIEVMVAMTVLSVGMLGLTALQIAGIRGNSLSRQNTEAGNLLKYHLESIMSADYDDPLIQDIDKSNNSDLTSTIHTDFQDVDAHGNSLNQGGYRVMWNVADDAPIEGTKTIVVLVTWKHGTRKRQLACIKSSAI